MATTQQKVQATKVFVSSTYQDLIPYRQKVNDSIQRLQQIMVGMELFGAEAETPTETCVARVKEAALFILIVGFRYGTIPEGYSKSITQIEYETAINAGIPTLVYMMDEEQPVPIKSVDFEHMKQLDDFKSLLKTRHVVSFFTTPEDLGSKVLADVQRELNKEKENKKIKIGNVSDNDIPSKEEALKIFQKFVLRPMRYDRKEIILPVTVVSGFSGWKLKERILLALGLTVGDTISCTINVRDSEGGSLGHGMLNESLSSFSLYAEGINADWLEDAVNHINQTIELRLRLRAVMVKGLSDTKPNEDSLYACAIVIGHNQ